MEVSGQVHAWATLCTTHLLGGWVGLRAIVDVLEKRNISCFCQELNPKPCSFYPVTRPTTLPKLLEGVTMPALSLLMDMCVTFCIS